MTTTNRRYNSTRRARQAAQTRAEVLAAAVALFAEHGWAATKLTDIAARAGVAVETIYSGFGSKKELLRAAMDVAVVGDAEPVPLADREEYARLGQGSFDERLRAAVEIATDIHERTAGVWHAFVTAAAADAEVEQWRQVLQERRRQQFDDSFALITERPVDAHVVDLLWGLFSSEVYRLLTQDRGWTRAEYEEWLETAAARLVAAA